MRTQRVSLFGIAAILLLLAALLPIAGQSRAAQKSTTSRYTDADWPRYTGDLAGTRYSKLKQINTTNVSKLASAWTFAGVGGEETPIVVGGVMYASTSTGVVAVDGDTGKEVWRYGAVPAPGGGGRGGGRGGARGAGTPSAAGAAPA